jgi:hypothetical protein
LKEFKLKKTKSSGAADELGYATVQLKETKLKKTKTLCAADEVGYATVQLKETKLKKTRSMAAADELGLRVERGSVHTVDIDPNIELPLLCCGEGSVFKYNETKVEIKIKTNAMKLLQNVNHGHYSVVNINKKTY